MPSQEPSPDQVRAALEEILGWAEVVRSPQLSKFLKYIVEATLGGKAASIKAYSIAVDVFGRPPTFDPQVDPIVRVQARRLRGLLQEFYRQDLGRTAARITLPVGRYVPEFEFVEGRDGDSTPGDPTESSAPPGSSAAGGARFGRRFWLQGLAALSLVAVLAGVLITLQVLRAPPPAPLVLPEEPTVLVASFSNESGVGDLDGFAGHLSQGLGALLAQFEDLKVGYAEANRAVPGGNATYVLSGSVRAAGTGLEIAASLSDGFPGNVVWSSTVPAPRPASNEDAVVNSAVRKIIREVGPFRGPVHAVGRRWLDEQSGPLPGVNGYVCMLTYRYARETGSSAKMARALECNERLLAEQPDLPLVLAAEAWLQGTLIVNEATPDDDLDVLLAMPSELAVRALDLAPESSFAYEQLAVVRDWQGRLGAAQQNFSIALGFQSLNTDARAAYAIALGRSNTWEQAAQQAQFALADSAWPSPWYYFPVALQAFRAGGFEQALADAKRSAAYGAGEIGSMFALASAALTGKTSDVTDYLPLVMSKEYLRRHGILPWLKMRVSDTELIDRLAQGLKAGGIPESALTAAF